MYMHDGGFGYDSRQRQNDTCPHAQGSSSTPAVPPSSPHGRSSATRSPCPLMAAAVSSSCSLRAAAARLWQSGGRPAAHTTSLSGTRPPRRPSLAAVWGLRQPSPPRSVLRATLFRRQLETPDASHLPPSPARLRPRPPPVPSSSPSLPSSASSRHPLHHADSCSSRRAGLI